MATASFTQARQPIHAGAIGRWRRYAEQLRPLIDALGGGETVERLAASEQL